MSPAALLVVFVGALLLLSAGAAVVVYALSPSPKPPPCKEGQVCAPPPSGVPVTSLPPGASPLPTSFPTPPASSGGRFEPPNLPESTAPPLITGQIWRSASLGYSFEYDPDLYDVSSSSDTTAVLGGTQRGIVVDGATADTSVDQMLQRELSVVDGFVLGRTPDTSDADAVLGAHIGYVNAQAQVYSGTLLDDSGTPSGPINVTIVTAGNGRITVAVIVLAANPDDSPLGVPNLTLVRQRADQVLKTFDWGAG